MVAGYGVTWGSRLLLKSHLGPRGRCGVTGFKAMGTRSLSAWRLRSDEWTSLPVGGLFLFLLPKVVFVARVS